MAIFDPSKIETGDVYINKLNIVKVDGSDKYSIFAQFTTGSIYEDLFSSVIYAEFKFHDELSILKTFPIIGKEYIDIDFNTPGRSQHYTLQLYVYAVTDVHINFENNWAEYTLKCCSRESFYNNQTTMDKYYLTTISDMINDVMVNYLHSNKTLNINSTQGIQHIVPARISPFEFIDILKSRAKSPNRQSSSYVFFENRDGFHFTTLEDLIQVGTSSGSNKTYYKQTALQVQLQNQWSHWDIIDYGIAQEFNVLDGIKIGSYQGLMESFDLHTKTFYTNKYNRSQFSQFVTLDSGVTNSLPPINVGQSSVFTPVGIQGGGTSDIIRSAPDADFSQYGSNIGNRYYNIADSYRPATYIESMLPNKFGFMGVTLTSMIDIYINGDTTSTVGDVFNIQTPKADKLTNTPPNTGDYLTNGNYLTIKIRHNLLNSHKKPKYTQIVTLAKGTFNNMPSGGIK